MVLIAHLIFIPTIPPMEYAEYYKNRSNSRTIHTFPALLTNLCNWHYIIYIFQPRFSLIYLRSTWWNKPTSILTTAPSTWVLTASIFPLLTCRSKWLCVGPITFKIPARQYCGLKDPVKTLLRTPAAAFVMLSLYSWWRQGFLIT